MTLITDADSAVTGAGDPGGATGVVEPDVGNPNDLQLDFLERGADIARGPDGGHGRLLDRRPRLDLSARDPDRRDHRATVEEQQAYQRVHLEPFADLRDMDFVKVLTTPLGAGSG